MHMVKMESVSVVARNYSMFKVIIGIGILAVVGGGFLLSTRENASLNEQEKRSQRQLKNLSFVDYQGNTVELADFTGTPLVINAWAAWCPFCVKELPDFVSLQKEFPEAMVIAINRVESLNIAKSYTDDAGITDGLVFLLDRSDSFYKSIGGFTMPETIFVDAQGIIQDHKRGPMDLEEMKERLETIL